MRLVKLSVQRFQCIDTADVEFGPGLNVLFGPNDLGKSSLAWAIRAVLLLQHNSSQHERFVSWYGDGEPRVALTFADADNRYWRVTKTFGGSAGRSLLESSKDGRTFSSDATGRQVDEKLRKLLGWGISAPGGTGGTRGFPDSFLAQVLLSEQDNVRKVLFDTSLTQDADESGRQRLTDALGALAQDPLFKQILDDAQKNVDRAFTPTGRKKKTAGAPFIAIAERINGLRREHDELEAKVRDTASAEARISELIEQRDATERELATAKVDLARLQASLVVARRRGELTQQIAIHTRQLEDAASLQGEIERAQLAIDDLQRQLALRAARLVELTAIAATQTGARDAARQRLDALTLEEGASDRQRTELEDQQRAAQEQLQLADRAHERAIETERAARAAAEAVATATTAIGPLATASATAEANRTEAARRETAAQQALEHARQRLREATSGDQAQARELRRTELENQRLSRAAARTETVALLRQLAGVTDTVARAQAAHASGAAIAKALDGARTTVAATEQAIAKLDASAASLELLQRFGRLRAARADVAAASEAAERAASDRANATALRANEASLRATVRDDLPPASQVAELRRLFDDLRVAEARLGGGLSLTVRPRRELTMTASVDGVPGAARTLSAPLTLTSTRAIALAIDDLVEIEITAGEADARTRASELRTRWATEGDSLLRNLGVETVDALEALLAAAETTRRAADERHREADAADQRAAQHASPDQPALATRVRELEQALGAADQAALAAGLDKLGAPWEAALQSGLASIAADRQKLVLKLDDQRQQATRSEAQLEAALKAAATLQEEVDRRHAELPEAPAILEPKAQAALAAIDRELVELDHQLAALSGGATEDVAARADVEAAEQALGVATQQVQTQAAAATRARDAVVQAEARLEGARQRARELDADGVWATALQTGAALELRRWTEARDQAELARQAHQASCAQLKAKLEELARTRSEAIQNARDALTQAEAAAVASATTVTTTGVANQQRESDLNARRLAAAEMKTRLAGFHLDAARTALDSLQRELAATAGDDGIDDSAVAHQEGHTRRLDARLRDTAEELARARGALEQVGGAIVRERQRELGQAIERETRREHEIEVEYDAWKLLVETMRTTESTEGAHLGRALAGPVSQRFRELTEGRYGSLELGAHLEATGLQVAGDLRDFTALSAGTQDQLATLLRLCVAEQLRTGIVLDDHLSQTDPKRVSWFSSVLRAAAHQIQIVFITCRPSEVLADGELPAATEAMRSSAADQLRAIDLTRVIHRFAASPPEPRVIVSPPTATPPRARSTTGTT